MTSNPAKWSCSPRITNGVCFMVCRPITGTFPKSTARGTRRKPRQRGWPSCCRRRSTPRQCPERLAPAEASSKRSEDVGPLLSVDRLRPVNHL